MEDYQNNESNMPELNIPVKADNTPNESPAQDITAPQSQNATPGAGGDASNGPSQVFYAQNASQPNDTYRAQETNVPQYSSYTQKPLPQNNNPQYGYQPPQPYQPQGNYQTPGNYTPNQNGYKPQYTSPQMNYPPQNVQYPPNNYAPQYQPYNQAPSSGKATASLVLGIISLVLSWIAFFNVISIICGIIGIVLGAGARREMTPAHGSRGTATAGMVCSIIALVISVLILASFMIFGIFTASSVDYGFGPSFSM